MRYSTILNFFNVLLANSSSISERISQYFVKFSAYESDIYSMVLCAFSSIVEWYRLLSWATFSFLYSLNYGAKFWDSHCSHKASNFIVELGIWFSEICQSCLIFYGTILTLPNSSQQIFPVYLFSSSTGYFSLFPLKRGNTWAYPQLTIRITL